MGRIRTISVAATRYQLRNRRLLLSAAYVTLLVALCIPAIDAMRTSGFWSESTILRSVFMMAIPSALLLTSVISRLHSLAWSVFWAWALIFLGLAPAYQLARGGLPWGAQLDDAALERAQTIVLTGYSAAALGFLLVSWFTRSGGTLALPRLSDGRPKLERAITAMILGYSVIAIAFTALMGPALLSGRSQYSARLVEISDLPGSGSAYFLATAGAIVVPAVAITLKKLGLRLNTSLIAFVTIIGFVAVNPLIGSRFLTGSFLVATAAALMSRESRRWLPIGLILLLVTIFPTLDLLRGDGTGATRVEITDPGTTLVGLDYDAFEMLVREATLDGRLPLGFPSKLELMVAPILRWVPVASDLVKGNASGPAVAGATGMNFTNVSMPLWGEADLIGGELGVISAFAMLGALLALTRRSTSVGAVLAELPVAALLFIVLRGSLYEVLGYILLAVLLSLWLARLERKDTAPPRVPSGSTKRRV